MTDPRDDVRPPAPPAAETASDQPREPVSVVVLRSGPDSAGGAEAIGNDPSASSAAVASAADASAPPPGATDRLLADSIQSWMAPAMAGAEIASLLACRFADAFAVTARAFAEFQARSAEATAGLVHSVADAKTADEALKAHLTWVRRYNDRMVAHAERLYATEVDLARGVADTLATRGRAVAVETIAPVL